MNAVQPILNSKNVRSIKRKRDNTSSSQEPNPTHISPPLISTRPLPTYLPLSQRDLEIFQTKGFVLLKQAFCPKVAKHCREFVWSKLDFTEPSILESKGHTWPKIHHYLSTCFYNCSDTNMTDTI